MPFSKLSILVVEDDSRISRIVRDALEKGFPHARVEIAGSAAKAKTICEKFPPTWIVWDGAPNERGTTAEYAACIPLNQWKNVIPISIDAAILGLAKERGALDPIPKDPTAMHTWAEGLVGRFKKLIPKKGR
jgi:CheY-like chemotaxis protein